MTRAARQASAAADALLDWLRGREAVVPASHTPDAAPQDEATPGDAATSEPSTDAALTEKGLPRSATVTRDGTVAPEGPALSCGGGAEHLAGSEALHLAHTDWLFHHLDVSGPAEMVEAFRQAARGAGIIPWHLDLDRIEEDAFLLLASPPAPQIRTLSAAGARILAEELRIAVARRHEAALARVGRSGACPLDLHVLLPVPAEILRLGPDDRRALEWLWAHWGTTQALRHVTALSAPEEGARSGLTPGEARLSLRFWSADWSPWRALLALQAHWPALRWQLQPRYDAT